MILYFDFAGISFRVKADITDGQVEHIAKVQAVCHTGEYVTLEVEPVEFLETLQDTLNEAVEQAVLNARLAHEDMLFEQAREEGRL